jgi:hypothetical protein
VFTLGTVAFSAQAAELEYDSYGLRSNPTCDREQSALRYFVEIRNQPPPASKLRTINGRWKFLPIKRQETGLFWGAPKRPISTKPNYAAWP